VPRRHAPGAGTLEYDRITLPAPAAERIVAIDVREGQRVKAGQPMLQLELDRTRSATEAARAQATAQRASLEELEAGPRSETIAQARAELAAAQAQAREASDFYARVRPLGRQQLIAAAEVDRARASAENTAASVACDARLRSSSLKAGTRREQIARGQAALAASEAEVAAQQVTLDKLSLVAPRDALVDSLPFKLGDQAAVGQPLAILLVGAPYAARVRARTHPHAHQGGRCGTCVRRRAQGWLAGTVRLIRTEPTFTPTTH
jgi:HlyD family secretion protein